MVQRRKLVYIVIFSVYDEDGDTVPSIHGVFSKKQLALDSIPEHDKEVVSYFTIETELDSIITTKITEDEIQDALIELMNSGLVEQLVDESGNFVYIAVDKPKES